MKFPHSIPLWRTNGELLPGNAGSRVVLSSVGTKWNDVVVEQHHFPSNWEAITSGSEGQINIDLQAHSGSGEGRYFPRNANYCYLHAHPAGDLFHLAINSFEST
jgi:hypothetical protein